MECGICLELFQDPRSLPCLHTFCRECIQRSLNEKNHSLKCPVCRAKHELGEGAGLLPVNQYALQELPLKRLQQQREKNGVPHQLVECKSCGEQAGPVVAWCEDCNAMICQPCVTLHKKIAGLRGHLVVNEPTEGQIGANHTVSSAVNGNFIKCLNHPDQNLKYFCIVCSELACSDCLLADSHAGHEHRLVEEARNNVQTEIMELAGKVAKKREEFSEYLDKASKAEGDALEYSELMKSEVNNVFDGIIASVEAQRNEALQSVSQGVKKIWSQKEMMEVGLAQLDSFTRFADHAKKCTTDARFVAMATQGIKLMKQLKNTHGDEAALDKNMTAIMRLCRDDEDSPLHVDLSELLVIGRPSFVFSPSPESGIVNGTNDPITVTLMVGGETVFSEYLRENCTLHASLYWSPKPADDLMNVAETVTSISVNQFSGELDVKSEDDNLSQDDPYVMEGYSGIKLISSTTEDANETCYTEDGACQIECSTELMFKDSDMLVWAITANLLCLAEHYCRSLVVRCKLSGAISSETVEVRIQLLDHHDHDDELCMHD